MPIAGGILVAGTAAHCLSSAAGMLRFLARLSGRRRHVRRSSGPGVDVCPEEGEPPGPAGVRGACEQQQQQQQPPAAATTTPGPPPRSLDRAGGGGRVEEVVVEGQSASSSAEHHRHRHWHHQPHPHPHRAQQHPPAATATAVQQRRHSHHCCHRHRRPHFVRRSPHVLDDVVEDVRSHPSSSIGATAAPISITATTTTAVAECLDADRDDEDDDHRRLSRRVVLSSIASASPTTTTRRTSRTSGTSRTTTTTTTATTTTTTTTTTTATTTRNIVDEHGSDATATAAIAAASLRHRRHISDPSDLSFQYDRPQRQQQQQLRQLHHRLREDRRPQSRRRHDGDHGEDGDVVVQPVVRSVPSESSSQGSSSSVTAMTRGYRIPPYLATLLIISYTLFGIADACSSRSTPKPRPPAPTPRPNITYHMYTCPPDYAEWYCLNGATCFTVKIVDSLLYNCLCANGYIGQRCEFKDLDGSYLPSRQRVMLETASIAGGATIAVFLVVIICIAAYIHCKRKQKELRTSGNCVDTVDGPGRDPELRPFSNRSRSLMIFVAKNPNGSTAIEQTRMPGWNNPEGESMRMVSISEGKRSNQ